MKIEIEEYKGQTIQYDVDDDKFVCDMEIEGSVKGAKRGSLKDLRSAIDQFIKYNLNFKPFKLLSESWGEIRIVKIEQIRSDNKLVNKSGYRSELIGKKQAEDLFDYDESIVNDFNSLTEEDTIWRNQYKSRLEKIKSRLKKWDHSKYDLS